MGAATNRIFKFIILKPQSGHNTCVPTFVLNQMKSLFGYPVVVLPALGSMSGVLGAFGPAIGVGAAPQPGLYMVLAGLWFGIAVAVGVGKFGNKSFAAYAIAIIATWIAWEIAVNLAIQITEVWLKPTVLSNITRMYIGGFAAGAVGAFLTWAGVAAFTIALRRINVACMVTVTGALFGLLLPLSSQFDHPAILLVPWQIAVAGALAIGLDLRSTRPAEFRQEFGSGAHG